MGLQPFASGALTKHGDVWERVGRKRGDSKERRVSTSEDVTARTMDRVIFADSDVLKFWGKKGSDRSVPVGNSKHVVEFCIPWLLEENCV